MDYKELAIIVVILLACVFTIRPAINNFKVVLNDKANTRVTPGLRTFVLLWLGFGVVCIIFVFFVTAYSLAVRLGLLN